MRLVDSHCHLNADRFDGDVDLVIGGARLAGVERILVPGWNVASSERALGLVDRYPWLDAAVGVHPHDAAKVDDAGWARIVALGRATRGSWRSARPASTTTASSARSRTSCTNLRRNLALALETGKPAILHCRSADGGAMPRTRSSRSSGRRDRRAAGRRRSATDRRRSSTRTPGRSTTPDRHRPGLAVSFSGLVFRRGEEASADAAALVPPDRLLVETDSPFLSPPGAPRKRNEPEWVARHGALARRAAR